MTWNPERACALAAKAGAVIIRDFQYTRIFELNGVKFAIATNLGGKVTIYINELACSGQHVSQIKSDVRYGYLQKSYPRGAKKGLRASVIRLLRQDQAIYFFHLKKESQFHKLLEWYSKFENMPEMQQSDESNDKKLDSSVSLWPFGNNSDIRPDERKKALKETVVREGQDAFRKQLEKLSHGVICSVTGCQQAEVVQAAHLAPYRGTEDNHSSNGILLRADIHLLFDNFLLGIEPDTLVVAIHDPLLQDDYYQSLNGKLLQVKYLLSPEALHLRWKWFQEHTSQSEKNS